MEDDKDWNQILEKNKNETNQAIADAIPYNEIHANNQQKYFDNQLSGDLNKPGTFNPYDPTVKADPNNLRGVTQIDQDWAKMPKRSIENLSNSTVGSKYNTDSSPYAIGNDVKLNRNMALEGNTKDVGIYYTSPELTGDLAKLKAEPAYKKGNPAYKRIAQDETRKNHANQIVTAENKIKDKINQQVAMNNDPALRKSYIERFYPDLAKRNQVKELQDLNNYRLSLLQDPAEMLKEAREGYTPSTDVKEDSHDYTDAEKPEQITGTNITIPENTDQNVYNDTLPWTDTTENAPIKDGQNKIVNWQKDYNDKYADWQKGKKDE